ncbi:MAG: YdcF family protein [Chloroflexi bacterium]|nr:YdcF family protein [Chloroflexota bacterium]
MNHIPDFGGNVQISTEEAEHITQYLDVHTAAPQSADFAFVFGTRRSEPAHIAADLFRRSVVRYVVLCGGENRFTGVNEANMHLGILFRNSVPRNCIIVEEKSTNTLENVVFARPKMEKCIELRNIKSVLVVTKWYHCRRVMMTLKRHLPQGIRYFTASYEPADVTRSNWWLSEEGRKRVLKEWHNIPRYLKQDDIAEIMEYDGAFV